MLISQKPFRKKRNWLVSVGTEAMAPLLRQYARHRTGAAVSDPRQWKRALLLGDNHAGDLLYRTCSLQALKHGLPDCEIFYLAAPDTAPVLEGNPAVTQVLPWARSDSRLDLSPKHVEALRSLHFDAALCTNCIQYWPELLLAVRLGIPNRAGYTYKGLSGWVTHPVPISYPQPFAMYFRNYVAALTGRALSGPLRPEIFLTEAAESEAASARARMKILDAPVLACFITSRQPTASWPVDRYLSVFRGLSSGSPLRIVLMGAAADSGFLREVSARSGLDIPVCAGELSLQGLAAFLKRCAVVLTKDSGPRHIANAVGTTALFFRNSASSQVETGVYCDSEIDLVPPGEFLGLRRQEELLARVDPDAVCDRIRNALKRQ